MSTTSEAISRLTTRTFRLLPTNLISRTWGRFARTSASRYLIEPFARAFEVSVEEAEMDLKYYPSLNAFFTRRLKPGYRTVDDAPDGIVSPVDGKVAAAGSCDQGQLLQVKGMHFSLMELLQDEKLARHFEDGSYATFYLSPRDYHRVHAPLDLSIHKLIYTPGILLPVNPSSVRFNRRLYSRNERIVISANSRVGEISMVLVGAQCVGSISLSFHDLTTNRPRAGAKQLNFEIPETVGKGDEIGIFEMGSTVLLLFAKGKVRLDLPGAGTTVRFGQRIGSFAGGKEASG